MRSLVWVGWLVAVAGVTAQTPVRSRPVLTPVAQPAGWVPFEAVIEHDGAAVGRFWRDRAGSTRLAWEQPDADGRTVVIRNIPEARYYVYRPAVGWTAQPMVLPTDGWRPPPVGQTDAGTPLAAAVEGVAVYEREADGRREHRAPALNFFAVVRDRPDGSVERYRQLRIGDVAATLFAPPTGAAVTVLPEPGGLVALPSRPGGGR